MKTTSIILSLLLLSSCYSYKVFDPEEYAAELAKKNEQTTNLKERSRSKSDIAELRRERMNSNQNASRSSATAIDEEGGPVVQKTKEDTEKPIIDPSTIKITDIIKPDQFYKVDSQGKEYTIEAKQWKADTLYAVVKGTAKELKFHKDDISTFKIRKFSKGKSDAFTVAAYAMGGAAVLLLLK